MALLIFARSLVGVVPLRLWSRWFGTPANLAEPHCGPVGPVDALRARRVGRAVGQAGNLLPFACKCLPRAMAGSIMLRRRAIPAALVIGVLPSGARGTGDDLHAWVACGAETVIGDGQGSHAPLLVLRKELRR